MNKKNLVIAAVIAGAIAALANLLVEWLLNGKLVSADFIASAVVGVLTPLAIFILLRKRSGGSGA